MDLDVEVLVKTAAELIGFHTTAKRHEHERSSGRSRTVFDHCLQYILDLVAVQAPELQVRTFVSRGKPSLIIQAREGPVVVLLAAHLDVVEPSAEDGEEAFHPRVDDGRLFGRGAADMKTCAAVLLHLLLTHPSPGLALLLTLDEEAGGVDGVEYVAHQWELEGTPLPQVVYLPDGGAGERLVCEQKGLCRVRVRAYAKGGHASRPWQGGNALVQIWRAHAALLDAFPLPTDEGDWRPSIALTDLHGGDSLNALPTRAEAVLDVRFPGGDYRCAELLAAMRERLASLAIAVELHGELVASPFVLDQHSRWVGLLQQAARETLGAPLELTREAGASDAHWLAERGITVLLTQPVCGNWHATGEYISLSSVARFVELTRHFVQAALV
jgi:succinyl-diaminopimelate desuccinylase